MNKSIYNKENYLDNDVIKYYKKYENNNQAYIYIYIYILNPDEKYKYHSPLS